MSLDGFMQHGVQWVGSSGNQKVGACPKCNKHKLYVNEKNLLWDCKVCGDHGNWDQFLAWRQSHYAEANSTDLLERLSLHRGISVDTLKAWNVGWSEEESCYTIPDYHGLGLRSVCDLHRYWPQEKKRYSTKGGKHGLMHVFVGWEGWDGADTVWIAEGEWDAMALWEALRAEGSKDIVVGVSGCSCLPQKLLVGLSGKKVRVAFDNDKAGRSGQERLLGILSGIAKEVHGVVWTEGLSDGFDVRDLYAQEERDSKKFLTVLRGLLGVEADEKKSKKPKKLAKRVTENWVEDEYRKWLHLNNPEILSVIFGTLFANRLKGDPLWMFLTGPSGDGKTEFLLSLSGIQDTYTVTTLTPRTLISGSNFGGVDASLIPKLDKKTLIIKDFTTIMNMNRDALDEIMGVLRDAYDGSISKEFGNGVKRSYESHFGILAGVTPAVELLRQTGGALGERFLKYRTRAAGKVESGMEALMRAVENIDKEVDMRAELQAIAKRVAESIPEAVKPVQISAEYKDKIIRLARWVALMRGVVCRERYTNLLQFRPSPEQGTRLAKQLCKIGMGISIYRGEEEMSERTYLTVAHIARDTAPDRAEELVKQMYLGEAGSVEDWARLTRFPQGTVQHLLQDFDMLNVVKKEDKCWILGPAMRTLMDDLGMYSGELQWKQSKSMSSGKKIAGSAKQRRKNLTA